MAEGFRIASAYVTVDPDLEGFKQKLQAGLDEAVAGVSAKVPVGLDQERLDADAEEVKSKVEGLSKERAAPKLGADDDEAKAKIADLKAQIDRLKLERQGITLDADASPADVKIAQLQAELDKLKTEEAKPRLALDDDDFRTKSDIDKAQFDRWYAARAEARLGLNDADFQEKLAEDETELRGFGAITQHPVISAIVGGLTALSPGIGAGVAGLGLLAGTGALAFGGILKAVQAHAQATQNIGITGAQMASTAFSNAVAVQQAQVAIQQAMQQSAQDAKASAQAIIQSQQQVTLAEQQLGDAQFSEREAQVNLTAARIQARLTLQQLNDAERDSILATRGAKLALQQAEYQQKLTDQNAFSTQLDKQQAALAVAQAQRQVIEAEQNQANSAAAAHRANKLGVGGSQQVVVARHAVYDATVAVKDAEMALAAARRAARFTEEQASYQAKRDAEAVAQAERNLTNTITEQRLAWAATMSTANQAANQFALDMSRLSAPARMVVNEILRMHGAIRILEQTAQRTIAPGLSVFFHGLLSIMPIVRRGVAEMGRAMSSAFGSFGRLMQTSAFREGLAGLLRNGVQFANIVLPAFAGFLQMMGKIGGKRGAALGLANLLAGLAHGLTGLVQAVSPAIPSIDKLFSVIGQALASVGPLLGTLVADLAQTLAPALQAVLPGLRVLAASLVQGLGFALRALGPALLVFGQHISDILIALSPLLPLIGRWVGQMITGLVPVAQAVTPLFAAIAQALPPILQNLTPLIKPTAQFTLMLAGFSPAVSDVLGWLSKFAGYLLVLTTAIFTATDRWRARWTAFRQWAVGLWHGFSTEVQVIWRTMTDWVTSRIDGFLSWAKSAMHTGVHDLGLIWHAIEPAFKTPVNFLIGTVYDNGIRRLWDDIVNVVGLGSLKLPVIPQMAGGGLVPGHDRGYDSQLVMMRPGEGVLTTSAVQGLGPGFVHAANKHFGGSGHDLAGKELARQAGHHAARVPEHLLGFKTGGILGWIDRGITDIGKILLGGIGAITGLITNPVGTIEHLLDRVVGTPAKGGLGQVLTAIPKALIAQLAHAFALDSPAAGLGIGYRGNLQGTPLGKAMVKYGESWIGRVPYVFGGTNLTPGGGVDCSGFTMDIYRRFGFNPPRTSEAQWGWVQRTPHPVLGGLAFFTGSPIDPPPGHVGLITGSNQMVDAYGTGFGVRYNALYGSSGSVWGFGVPPGSGMAAAGGGKLGSSFDGGGYLMPAGSPGGGPGWNFTGQPEAVLDPRQTQLLERLIQALEQRGALQPAVNFNYFGPQMPTAEMRAQQRRDLAMMLGGG